MKPLFGLLLALLCTQSALAADPVYEVEMIIFAHTFDSTSKGGRRQSIAPQACPRQWFSLDMLGGLPLDDLQLTNTVARLKADPGYQVLLHQAWRQPVGTSATAPWLRCYSAAAFRITARVCLSSMAWFASTATPIFSGDGSAIAPHGDPCRGTGPSTAGRVAGKGLSVSLHKVPKESPILKEIPFGGK